MLTTDTKEETAITRQESLGVGIIGGILEGGNFFIEPLRRWGKQLTSA